MEDKLLDIGERIAVALEKATEQPVIQGNPPICPHCQEFDPVIHIEPEEGASGHMSQIVIQGRCLSCGETIYSVCESFSVHQTLTTLKKEMEMKKEAGWFGE